MDTEQLKTFVDVIDQGSFAAVARQRNVAPSAVTRAVAGLEQTLGVRLLQRTTRRLALTEAGEAFLLRAREALALLDEASEAARDRSGQAHGRVRLTTSVTYGQHLLLPLLPALHREHPGLSLDLQFSDQVVDLLAERVDLALRLGPPTDSSLVGLQLQAMRYRVCASPDYLARHGRPATPAELGHHDCLRFPLPGFATLWRFREGGAGPVEAVPVKGWLTLSPALALHQAARDGLGPVLLAEWLVAEDLAAGRLVDLFPQHEVTASHFDSAVWLLYPSREHLPLRVRVLIDFLKARLMQPDGTGVPAPAQPPAGTGPRQPGRGPHGPGRPAPA